MTNRKPLLFQAEYEDKTPTLLYEFLKKNSGLSGRSLNNFFFKGLIYLNQRKAHSKAKIKTGDIIQVYIMNDEHLTLKPEKLPIDIVYENPEFLIINKPPLIAVHPSGNITSGTLANRVAAYFENGGLKIKVRPVNRLDYGTSGLVIFAKNAQVQSKLSDAIRNHRLTRIYRAVVKGIPTEPEGIVALPIATQNQRRFVNSDGMIAETHYQVIQTFNNASLLELTLKTGRTHQIRVHLSHIGYPILGDLQYGIKSQWINRPALHAYKLNFEKSGFLIPEILVELPEDIKELIGFLY